MGATQNPTDAEIAEKCLAIMLDKIEDAKHVHLPPSLTQTEDKITHLIECLRVMNNIPEEDTDEYETPVHKFYERMSWYRNEAEMCLVYGVDDVDELCFE